VVVGTPAAKSPKSFNFLKVSKDFVLGTYQLEVQRIVSKTNLSFLICKTFKFCRSFYNQAMIIAIGFGTFGFLNCYFNIGYAFWKSLVQSFWSILDMVKK
jgi:hypothetical protein